MSSAENDNTRCGGKCPKSQNEEVHDVEQGEDEDEEENTSVPPIVFRDTINEAENLDALAALLESSLTEEDKQTLAELTDFLLNQKGIEAIGEGFVKFIETVLIGEIVEARIYFLNILAALSLLEDGICLIEKDEDNKIMSYCYKIEEFGLDEQLSIALFMANVFETIRLSAHKPGVCHWVHKGKSISHMKVLTKVSVHALLADDSDLRKRGDAIVNNLACMELESLEFDEEEIVKVLEVYFATKQSEEDLHCCERILAKLSLVSDKNLRGLIRSTRSKIVT